MQANAARRLRPNEGFMDDLRPSSTPVSQPRFDTLPSWIAFSRQKPDRISPADYFERFPQASARGGTSGIEFPNAALGTFWSDKGITRSTRCATQTRRNRHELAKPFGSLPCDCRREFRHPRGNRVGWSRAKATSLGLLSLQANRGYPAVSLRERTMVRPSYKILWGFPKICDGGRSPKAR